MLWSVRMGCVSACFALAAAASKAGLVSRSKVCPKSCSRRALNLRIPKTAANSTSARPSNRYQFEASQPSKPPPSSVAAGGVIFLTAGGLGRGRRSFLRRLGDGRRGLLRRGRRCYRRWLGRSRHGHRGGRAGRTSGIELLLESRQFGVLQFQQALRFVQLLLERA